MLTENAHFHDAPSPAIARKFQLTDSAEAHGAFSAQLVRDGATVWRETFQNLVLTAGKNNLLDTYFAGASYTAAWYMGLVDGGSSPVYNATDMAASHGGWTENVGFSGGARPSVAWTAASGGSKASTSTVFNINATGTIAGCFIASIATLSGSTGIVYSAGSFTSGNRSVLAGDTLSVVWTGSL